MRQESIAVIYIDLHKAFDQIGFNVLLTKLDKFGFSNNLLQIFRSYLFDR